MQQSTISSKESLLARYILETNATIRQTASQFDMSKSNVHTYVSHKLKKSDYPLYQKVQVVLNQHFDEKPLRGGKATRSRYLPEKINER